MKVGEMLWNSLFTAGVAAGLAYLAYGTAWHSALFGFLGFTVHAVGNRISLELSGLRAGLRQLSEDQATVTRR